MSTPRKSPKRPATRTAPAPSGPNGDRPAVPVADRPVEDDFWPRVTRELADDLAVDALARDRAGKVPFDEVARLQEAGLPALLTPPGPDRRGVDWRSACAVVREISAADSSVGELLAHHYALSWTGRFLDPLRAARDPLARAAEENWLLAGEVEPPRAESGHGLVLTPSDTDGGGWFLDGTRAFASAVTVADRLVVGARPGGTGDQLVVLVDPGAPGVFTEAGTDRVGQRLAGAGTVTFERVPVAPGQVLGALPHDEHAVAPFATLAPIALRLLLVHVGLGIAEGALAEARDISRAGHAGPAPAGHPARLPATEGAGDDPYLLLAYGELATAAHTAAAVVERATDALTRGLLAGWTLGAEERADVAVLVSAAEAVAGQAAVQITTRVLELVDGAPGTGVGGGGPGFDRFWRNARALTVPTQAAHRLRDIGDHYLNSTHARLTLLA
ncbi:acyl-CoA dehydrogenase family protein [Streptomyces sp. NPDC093249]|uniref:acyl-CoA dehydrogenase family protein n=1 Tax=unclassified Streptomyces TaxID=2593676 RepID=UPI003450DED7